MDEDSLPLRLRHNEQAGEVQQWGDGGEWTGAYMASNCPLSL